MSVNLFQTNFPPSNAPIVDDKGAMSTLGMAFFRALYNRTGESVGTPFSTATNLVAVGATQGTALPLIDNWNNITSGAGSGVILPAMTMGQSITVFNNLPAGNLNIYPPSGGNITFLGIAQGINNALVSAAPDFIIFYYFSDTDIQAI